MPLMHSIGVCAAATIGVITEEHGPRCHHHHPLLLSPLGAVDGLPAPSTAPVINCGDCCCCTVLLLLSLLGAVDGLPAPSTATGRLALAPLARVVVNSIRSKETQTKDQIR
jgi:hypothetical protein